MGNAKLRREAARLLKARGLGPLYRGNKRLAWQSYPAYQLRRIITRLQLKEGDLQQDCDAFNHRFKRFKLDRLSYDGAEVVRIDDVEWMDGRYACGCGYSPSAPWSAEEINRYHCEFLREHDDIDADYIPEWLREAIARGWSVCDEDGLSLRKEIEARLAQEEKA